MDNINLDKIIKADELDYNMILSIPEDIGLKLQRIIQGQGTSQDRATCGIEIIENKNDEMDVNGKQKNDF